MRMKRTSWVALKVTMTEGAKSSGGRIVPEEIEAVGFFEVPRQQVRRRDNREAVDTGDRSSSPSVCRMCKWRMRGVAA